MNILYLSMSYVPSSRASTVQVLKMCDAFGLDGRSVTLVAKKGTAEAIGTGRSLEQLYGIKGSFDLAGLPRPARRGGELAYAARVLRFVESRRQQRPLVFARYLNGALYAALRGLPVVYEAHEMPDSALQTWQLKTLARSRHLLRIVSISRALRDDLTQLLPWLPEDRFVIAHDGCDETTQALKAPAFAPNGRLKLGYVGSLNPGKGADLVCALARQLPGDEFHIVGGSESQVSALRAAHPLPNLVFHGHIGHGDVPAMLDGFDVFLLPAQNRVLGASGRSDISRWMSPLKLFEYMRAGRPILCSDLPVLREVVSDRHTALMADPEDVEAWVRNVELLRGSPEMAESLARAAREEFDAHYTWKARSRAVVAGLD